VHLPCRPILDCLRYDLRMFGNYERYLYNHFVFSGGYCYITCIGFSFQGGKFSITYGQRGFATPGLGFGWASRGPDGRRSKCFGGGAGIGHGASGCVGIDDKDNVDWGDVELDYQWRPGGWWVGDQETACPSPQSCWSWEPGWLQWK